MSIAQHIPDDIKRVCRAIGYAAWVNDTDYWLGLSLILRARLNREGRAALAFCVLKSLDHETACMTADAALSDQQKQEEAA